MNSTIAALNQLFERIPRRHSPDNLKEINSIIADYETLLLDIEAVNGYYEKMVASYFDDLDRVRGSIKKSTENKHSKKAKDEFFAEGAGQLKESIEALIAAYGDGSRSE